MKNDQEVNKEKQLWIIDTDPGTDDLMCMLYMFNRPEVEVLFISLSEGNCRLEHVKENIKRTFLIHGKSYLTYVGSKTKMIYGQDNAYGYHYDDGMGDIDEIKKLDTSMINISKDSDYSAKMMVYYINKFPGKINILALAPLTNLALAYMIDPSITRKIKDIVTMGGSYLQRGNANATAEFNYYHDYLACHIFFRSFKNLLVVPWETCEFVMFGVEELKKSKEIAIEKWGSYDENVYKYIDLILTKYSKDKSGCAICDLYAAIAYFVPKSVKTHFISKSTIIIDSNNHNGSFMISDREDTTESYEKCIENYLKKGEEIKKGYNLYVEEMHKEIIVSEFSYVLKPN